MKDITKEELGAALVWLRNHYDVEVPETQTFKKTILEFIDEILLDDDGINPWITLNDMSAFREKYLGREAKPKNTPYKTRKNLLGDSH